MIAKSGLVNIVEITTEEFNKLKFDRRELPTREDNPIMEKTIKQWAKRQGADVVYKYDRQPTGFLWIVEEK